MLIKKREKDQRRLLAVLLLREAFLGVLLLVGFLAGARRLRLAPAFFLAAAFAAAFLFLVRAAFWAAARRWAFVLFAIEKSRIHLLFYR